MAITAIGKIKTGMAMVALLAGLGLAAPLQANGLTEVHDHGTTQEAGPDMMLESSDWRAVLVGETRLSVDDDVTIGFADGRVAGRSGCNRFTGSFEAGAPPAEDVAVPLALGPLAGTRMACPGRGDEVEAQVLPALERVDGFLIDAQGRLLLMAGAEVLLVAVPDRRA